MEHFEKLNKIDVSKKAEKKNKLTYLSWAWAWTETKKVYPDATYCIHKFENNLPYVYDDNTGYMVFTSVTIDSITHEMWLPVMDHLNKAMKKEPYSYKTKYDEKSVQAATMFDINKTIMRCLTKNLAMFGLGLYIYAGEDLPEVTEDVVIEKKKTTLSQKSFDKVIGSDDIDYIEKVLKLYQDANKYSMTDEQKQAIETRLDDLKQAHYTKPY